MSGAPVIGSAAAGIIPYQARDLIPLDPIAQYTPDYLDQLEQQVRNREVDAQVIDTIARDVFLHLEHGGIFADHIAIAPDGTFNFRQGYERFLQLTQQADPRIANERRILERLETIYDQLDRVAKNPQLVPSLAPNIAPVALPPHLGEIVDISLQELQQALQQSRELGRGGYGTVHLGNWRGIAVAIKQFHLSSPADRIFEEFRREATILAICNSCAQIVRIFAICLEQGNFALVMEYMTNGSLRDFLKHRVQMDWALNSKMGIQIGKGIHFLHSQNPPIIHRDIKSLNVLLDGSFNAKLCDFGISKITWPDATVTKRNGPPGTMPWHAPELYRGHPHPTWQADVYSFGMVLWEIGSGRMPYDTLRFQFEIEDRLRAGIQEPIPDHWPEPYRKQISRAIALNPKDRPSALDIATMLEFPDIWAVCERGRSSEEISTAMNSLARLKRGLGSSLKEGVNDFLFAADTHLPGLGLPIFPFDSFGPLYEELANEKNLEGVPVLHYAVQQRNFDVMIRLLDHRANLSGEDSQKRQALHVAAGIDDPRFAQALLEKGAKINVYDAYGRSPLQLAFTDGNISVARLIVAHRDYAFWPERPSGENSISPMRYSSKEEQKRLKQQQFFSEMTGAMLDHPTVVNLSFNPQTNPEVGNNKMLQRSILNTVFDLIEVRSAPKSLSFSFCQALSEDILEQFLISCSPELTSLTIEHCPQIGPLVVSELLSYLKNERDYHFPNLKEIVVKSSSMPVVDGEFLERDSKYFAKKEKPKRDAEASRRVLRSDLYATY